MMSETMNNDKTTLSKDIFLYSLSITLGFMLEGGFSGSLTP